MLPIVVVVSHGVARVAINPTNAEVEIVDLDVLREGAYEDVRRYWNDSLSAEARKYLRTAHPTMAGHLDPGAV